MENFNKHGVSVFASVLFGLLFCIHASFALLFPEYSISKKKLVPEFHFDANIFFNFEFQIGFP